MFFVIFIYWTNFLHHMLALAWSCFSSVGMVSFWVQIRSTVLFFVSFGSSRPPCCVPADVCVFSLSLVFSSMLNGNFFVEFTSSFEGYADCAMLYSNSMMFKRDVFIQTHFYSSLVPKLFDKVSSALNWQVFIKRTS